MVGKNQMRSRLDKILEICGPHLRSKLFHTHILKHEMMKSHFFCSINILYINIFNQSMFKVELECFV